MSFPDAVVADRKVGLRCLVPLHEGFCKTVSAADDNPGSPGYDPFSSRLRFVPLTKATGKLMLNSAMVVQNLSYSATPTIRAFGFGLDISDYWAAWKETWTKPGGPDHVVSRTRTVNNDALDGAAWFYENDPNTPGAGWSGPSYSDVMTFGGGTVAGNFDNLLAWCATGEVAEFFTGPPPSTIPGSGVFNLTKVSTLVAVSPAGTVFAQAVSTQAFMAPRVAGDVAQDCEVRVRRIGFSFGETFWPADSGAQWWRQGEGYGPLQGAGSGTTWRSVDSEESVSPKVELEGAGNDVFVSRLAASPTRRGDDAVLLRPTSPQGALREDELAGSLVFSLGRQGVSAYIRLRFNGRRERLSCLLYGSPQPVDGEPDPVSVVVETDAGGALYGAEVEATGWLRDGEWSLQVWDEATLEWVDAPPESRTAVLEWKGAALGVDEVAAPNSIGRLGARADNVDCPGHNINATGEVEARPAWGGSWTYAASDVSGMYMLAGKQGSSLAVLDYSGSVMVDAMLGYCAAYGIEVV